MIDFNNYKRLTGQKWSDKIDLKQEYGYSHIYKRLYELEDKIENGLLIPRHSISRGWQNGCWCIFGADERGIIIAQCKTEEEAKQKLKKLTESDTE